MNRTDQQHLCNREWYGLAPFNHPSPAPPSLLKTLFPSCLDEPYESIFIPPPAGETVTQLHDRVAHTLNRVISVLDTELREQDTALLICTHAATLIAIGRVLTGLMPEDDNEEDFLAPTAGLSTFLRKEIAKAENLSDWSKGQGVSGGWICKLNGDCSHLSGGYERAW